MTHHRLTKRATARPALPLDRQIRYATGLQYEINNDITIGGAFEFIDAGSSRINQEGGPLAGRAQGKIHYELHHCLQYEYYLEILNGSINKDCSRTK